MQTPEAPKKETDIVLHNVSALLQQLGEQIDAHEEKVQQKTQTQYQRNEQLVNNTINSLYVSITILMRETVKKCVISHLQTVSKQLFSYFELVGNVSFLNHAQEQELKQNLMTAQVLQNTQHAWAQALANTQPPDTSVEALLMSQAQEKFQQLDCHRRVLTVALQTYQTSQLHHEIEFINKVYTIKGQTLKALWERYQSMMSTYRTQCAQLVTSVQAMINNIKTQKAEKLAVFRADVDAFMTRFKKLWTSYKDSVQTVDDTSSSANDLRVALDTLLASSHSSFSEGLDLLQKHWSAVARHIEEVPGVVSPVVSTKSVSPKAALQKNADKMLYCAKERAKVLQNAKQYKSTSEWVTALRKWDSTMKQLEQEAHALRRQTLSTLQNKEPVVFPVLLEEHRRWKRLIWALVPLAEQLKNQEKALEQKQSSVYAVLLNKVGYELKQFTDEALTQVKTLESQHQEYERLQVEAAQENFRLLDTKFKSESGYMQSELQGYGPVSERCLDLITKLYKLKTWQEHSTQLQKQLEVLQPLVVQVSKAVSHC